MPDGTATVLTSEGIKALNAANDQRGSELRHEHDGYATVSMPNVVGLPANILTFVDPPAGELPPALKKLSDELEGQAYACAVKGAAIEATGKASDPDALRELAAEVDDLRQIVGEIEIFASAHEETQQRLHDEIFSMPKLVATDVAETALDTEIRAHLERLTESPEGRVMAFRAIQEDERVRHAAARAPFGSAQREVARSLLAAEAEARHEKELASIAMQKTVVAWSRSLTSQPALRR